MDYSGIIKTRDFDINEIISIWENSVRATHHFLSEEDLLFYKDTLQNEYFKDIYIYCIRNATNRIVAFMTVSENNIDALFIDSSERGKGLGKKMVRYAIDELSAISVEVNEQNEQAIGFYKKMGFHVIRRSEIDGQGKPYPILFMRL